ncbi:MAG: ABC transporter ATP-binding protein [Deltaproteobacteria bacterium]|jgi:ABC-2 type transport system ATP-binding protein|nr:ABC transporter ATP-binding protein [Deltaproteobacteria bacterium]MBT4527219.1 ABC transporter ATP-binding protein [Deltaproteobacteria bacterium]
MSNHPILSVSKLVKTFGKKPAVNAVDFTIQEGEFIGLLGANGAGKTTIIKSVAGLIKPTSGSILYYDKNFESHLKESKKLIGVVPQNSNLDRDLTAYENLYLHTLLHNIPVKEREAKIATALEFAELSEYRNKQVKTFSGGMKRRLVIVRALIHDPKIIFLDEPTVGLDPQIRRNLWNLILKINQVKKTAILLTTHYIEEAEKLCSRVMVIDHGDIIMDNTPEKLKHGLGRFVLEIYNEDGITETYFDSQEAALIEQGNCQSESKIRNIALEDVIIQLTGRRVNA